MNNFDWAKLEKFISFMSESWGFTVNTPPSNRFSGFEGVWIIDLLRSTTRLMDSMHLAQQSTMDCETVAVLVETPSAPHSSHAPIWLRQ